MALSAAVLIVFCGLVGTAHAAMNTYCSTGSTTYDGPNGGPMAVWGDGDNWTNGQPSAQCTAVIPANTTVTFSTAYAPDSSNTNGTAMAGLTIDSGATLIVEGVSSTVDGNPANAANVSVGADGLTIDAGATLDLQATAGTSQTSSVGEAPGGSANVTVESNTGVAAPVDNAGTIETSSSDSAWGESLGIAGTLTNSGTISDQSGVLTFQGQNLPYVVDNTGTMSVASGASFTMIAGDGSSFTNDGTFANPGTTTLQQSMHWVQSGGSETGNPVQLTNGETLDDSAGPGSFEVDNCTTDGLTGTIPAGQTVAVLGGCSGTTLSLGAGSNPPPVVNDGTLTLDAPATNGGGAILEGAELDNHGTLNSTIADASLRNQLLDPLVNEAGATVAVTGGELEQASGTPTTNAGTVAIGPGGLWLVQGGSFSNAGTIAPQISGATTLGQFNLTQGAAFTAGGTLAPVLTSGYGPAVGTEFPFITLNGGSVTGTFGTVATGFSADYTKETASPAYVGIVFGGFPATTTAPTVGRVRGGAGKLTFTLSCASSAGSCASYTARGTVTEHLKGKRLVAVAAVARPSKSHAKASKKVVLVGSSSGTLKPGKSATVTLKLNRTGAKLLKRFHRLKVRVTITSGGKAISAKTVTITTPKAKTKKKDKKKK